MKEEKIKRTKTPWPTRMAMDQVYEKNLWGGNSSPFYSGDGSHDLHIVTPYINAVTSFLKSFEESITVCDLGCGDFNIGKQLLPYVKKYEAVDIVNDLIEYNKANFKQDNLEFHCLDIAVDPLPAANCVIVRQVLQHLSNHEVSSIVRKLQIYKYVILTEHLPDEDFIANKDIISGQGIRLKKKSGTILTDAPFNFKVKKETLLIRTTLEPGKGVIVTWLYEVY
ncbi:class I SAM-dependent methyltransferase [Nonlabens sp.]|uniref:class I SAM-dependent methyltransferase n=1 Tax=Nonlabens sp. TaxID=1888209 RepID=UPI003263F7BE